MKKTKYRELMKFAQLIKNNFGFLWDQLITFNYLIDFAGCWRKSWFEPKPDGENR